jgi:N-acyl-D-amino-acid deacylase
VLAPLGIRDMAIARSHEVQRSPREVTSYDGDNRVIKGQSLELLDSHGGWVASAIDLVKFAAAFDRPAECPILNVESVKTITENGPVQARGPTHYGCGWEIRVGGRGMNWWHNGSLPGTSTLLVRRNDGLNWAVLFNTRHHDDKGKEPAAAIDGLLHRAAAEVKTWPDSALREP